MRFANAESRRAEDERLYRIYVTDSLAALTGARERYADWARPQARREQIDVDETVDWVIERAGLEVRG